MAGDRVGTGIVGSERQRGIAELLEHHQQVSRRAVEVLGDVMGIDAEIARSFRHQLAEPDGSNRAQRAGIIRALDLDIGPVEQRPIGNRQTSLAQSVMAAVAQRGCFNGVEDFWGGANRPRGDPRSNLAGGDIILVRLRRGKEKEAVGLRGAST